MKVSFQGVTGAYSSLAAKELFPKAEYVGCENFAAVLRSLEKDLADIAVIPVRNSTAGEVTDAVTLLREKDYAVLKTLWLPVRHCLLARSGVKLEDLRHVHSHWQALAQCQENTKKLSLIPVEESDTASAARKISTLDDDTRAAIASHEAAKTYGLKILQEDFQDAEGNQTLFFAVTLGGAEESLGKAADMIDALPRLS